MLHRADGARCPLSIFVSLPISQPLTLFAPWGQTREVLNSCKGACSSHSGGVLWSLPRIGSMRHCLWAGRCWCLVKGCPLDWLSRSQSTHCILYGYCALQNTFFVYGEYQLGSNRIGQFDSKFSRQILGGRSKDFEEGECSRCGQVHVTRQPYTREGGGHGCFRNQQSSCRAGGGWRLSSLG